MVASEQSPVEAYNARAELMGWPSRFDGALDFQAPELKCALAVWRNAGRGRQFPARTDLTPRLMKQFLSRVAIIDIVHEGERTRFRVRITGTNLEQTFGGLSGRFLDDCLPEHVLSRWEASLQVPLLVRAPTRSSGRVEFRDQTYLKIETLSAPLGLAAEPDGILLVVHVEPNMEQNQRVIGKMVGASVAPGAI